MILLMMMIMLMIIITKRINTYMSQPIHYNKGRAGMSLCVYA